LKTIKEEKRGEKEEVKSSVVVTFAATLYVIFQTFQSPYYYFLRN
jgi:hypothetical protein